MIIEVVKYPDSKLKLKSQKVVFDTKLKVLVQNMLDTINSFKDPPAAGLSAIQIGIPLRVLVARDFITTQNQENNSGEILKDYILINPKFVSLSKEKDIDWEGCLSFPDQYGKVERYRRIKLKYHNINGLEERLTASGFLARVIQHEMDHLDGITFNTKIIGKIFKGEELETGTKVAE